MTRAASVFLFLGCCILFFTNCSKKETMEIDNETQSVVDYSIADHEFSSLVPAVFQSMLNTKRINGQSTGSCDSLVYISGDTSDFAPNPVFEFPVSGSPCASRMPDGKVRTGKVIIRMSGSFKTQGSQLVLKLKDYIADGIQYACDSMVMTSTEIKSNYTIFSVKLINGSCKTGDYTIRYRFDKQFAVYPATLSDPGSAVAYIYGQSNGTNRAGIDFSTNVSAENTLVKRPSCRYTEKGLMTLIPGGFKERVINFGNGDCDDLATFTVNENTVAFKLK